MRTKRNRHWAAVGRKNRVILRDLSGHLSIWTQRLRAHVDCPAYGEVVQVEIRELPPKRRAARGRR